MGRSGNLGASTVLRFWFSWKTKELGEKGGFTFFEVQVVISICIDYTPSGERWVNANHLAPCHFSSGNGQWECQDPEMEVLYRLYHMFGQILWGDPLKHRPYIGRIYGRYLQSSSIPELASDPRLIPLLSHHYPIIIPYYSIIVPLLSHMKISLFHSMIIP